MKKFVFIICFCGVFFWFVYNFISSQFLKTGADFSSLKVETLPSAANVFLDGKNIGTTPFEGNNFKPGIYTLKLSLDNKQQSFVYQSKIELVNGTTTIVNRILGLASLISEESTSGYIVSFQKIKNNKTGAYLVVTSSPNKVLVYVDGVIKGETPFSQGLLNSGEYKIEVKKEDFVTQNLDLKIAGGYLVNVDVDLREDLYMRIVPLSETNLEEKKEDVKVNKRDDWGAQMFEIPEDKLSFSPWQKIELYTLSLNQNVKPEKLLQTLDFHAQKFLGLPAIPFGYLIDESGNIYEGFGIRDYDFSSLDLESKELGSNQSLVVGSGVLPIAYFAKESVLTDVAKVSVEKLLHYIKQSPHCVAKLVSNLNKFTLEPGKTQRVLLEFQNNGESVWKNDGPEQVILVVSPKKKVSQVYTSGTWLTTNKVTTTSENFVLPNKVGKFEFDITAPYYLGEFSEEFVLLDEKSGQFIEGSEVNLAVEVISGGKSVVEISQTPTGFLNVRGGPSLNSTLIGSVYPGEKYLFLEEQKDWYRIKLRDGSEGWVYAKYAQKK